VRKLPAFFRRPLGVGRNHAGLGRRKPQGFTSRERPQNSRPFFPAGGLRRPRPGGAGSEWWRRERKTRSAHVGERPQVLHRGEGEGGSRVSGAMSVENQPVRPVCAWPKLEFPRGVGSAGRPPGPVAAGEGRVLPPMSSSTRSVSTPKKMCGLAPGQKGKNPETERKPLRVRGLFLPHRSRT
jgi:hypothetical protein